MLAATALGDDVEAVAVVCAAEKRCAAACACAGVRLATDTTVGVAVAATARTLATRADSPSPVVDRDKRYVKQGLGNIVKKQSNAPAVKRFNKILTKSGNFNEFPYRVTCFFFFQNLGDFSDWEQRSRAAVDVGLTCIMRATGLLSWGERPALVATAAAPPAACG